MINKSLAAVRSPFLAAAALSLALSLLLFGLMYSVIRVGHHVLEKTDALPTIDFVRLRRDTDVETLARRKPPPPPAQPPPPSKMKISSDIGPQQGMAMDVPAVDAVGNFRSVYVTDKANMLHQCFITRSLFHEYASLRKL